MTDEATGFNWVFTHSTKDQSAVFVKAKIGKFMADGHRVKAIRWDRDAVYQSADMQKFLDKHITNTPTSGYSPPENGHAERAIGVLKGRVQCLLSDSGLSAKYWADALWRACYCIILRHLLVLLLLGSSSRVSDPMLLLFVYGIARLGS
jgi:hypothetical protein